MWPILTRKDSILYIHYIQHCSWILFFFYRQRDKIKTRQNRGRSLRTQAIYKESQKQSNKRKKKPREEKANQQANHPKNSEKKESSSSKTVETTQEETEKRGSSSKYLTSFPLGTFFGFALPKYTKKHK